MFTELQGYLVILRYDRAALDAALAKGGRVIKIVEFSEDTLDSCYLSD